MTTALPAAGFEEAVSAPPSTADAALRPLPYPYRGLLAICSDLDETPDLQTYFETIRFLNTTEQTAFGRGVGLETGNSLYFDMAPGEVSYWNAGDSGRAAMRALMRSGHIDCLHSFGDLAATRAHAGRALEELDRHGCRLQVWVDHAVAPTNFGSDIMRGSGDLPGAAAYHADLSVAYGIRYVWRGRVTSVAGQDVPRRVAAIFTPRHPLRSSRTLAKEAAKGLLGRGDGNRYAMHKANDVLRAVDLRSGHRVQEFIRSNPHWGGVSCGDTADGIAQVLTPGMLDELTARDACCVLYTHLGKARSRQQPFTAAARTALEGVARRAADGALLVTTTRRLLVYCFMRRTVRGRVAMDGRRATIAIEPAASLPAADLQGLTFYVPQDTAAASLSTGFGAMLPLRLNPPDHTGRPTASVPWERLECPQL